MNVQKIFSFYLNSQVLTTSGEEFFHLNKHQPSVLLTGTAADVLERFGVEEVKEHISTDKSTLAFADAGNVLNSYIRKQSNFLSLFNFFPRYFQQRSD